MNRSVSLAGIGVAAAATLLTAISSAPRTDAQAAIGFGHEVLVDHQRAAGEPSLSISPVTNSAGHHDIYACAPYGFSTTASFIWKSGDGGQTFHLIGNEVPPTGKPVTFPGGGDCNNVNDTAGNLYFVDLQGLTDVSAGVSTDGGNTFSGNTVNAGNTTPVDRPWISVDGNPLTTGREYMAVDQVSGCDPVTCGLGQAGSNVLALTDTSGSQAAAQVFSPLPAQRIEPDGIVGGTVVDPATHDLYIVHTGYTDASGKIIGGGDTNGNDNAIVVDRFPGGYSQTIPTPLPNTSSSISICSPYNTATTAPSGPAPCQSDTAFHAPLFSDTDSTATVGQDFSPMAIDGGGDLYIVWSQAAVADATGVITGPSVIYMASSADKGATWSAPINVSAQVPGLQTNLFPWLAAGSQGRLDIVWYGSPTLGNCPSAPCGSGEINGPWNVYMAQTLDAVSSSGTVNPSPTWSTTRVNEFSNHYGAICTMGIGCTTGGDRGLLDFIQVQPDPATGAADVLWSDASNSDFNGGESSAVIGFAQQTSGPGLFANVNGGTVSGSPPVYADSAPGSPASFFAGYNSETRPPAGSNVDIVKSSVTGVDANGNDTVTMQVGSLASLSVPAMGSNTDQDLIWLTRWEVPAASPTLSDQGHWFYAAMESDGGGTPVFYDGESVCGIASSHCKFITYPAVHAVSGNYTASGTITITVPAKDVGGPATSQLFSVTGVTATQPSSSALSNPANSGNIFNVIDSTPPYDVAATTASSTSPTPGTVVTPAALAQTGGPSAATARRTDGRLFPAIALVVLALSAGGLVFARRRAGTSRRRRHPS